MAKNDFDDFKNIGKEKKKSFGDFLNIGSYEADGFRDIKNMGKRKSNALDDFGSIGKQKSVARRVKNKVVRRSSADDFKRAGNEKSSDWKKVEKLIGIDNEVISGSPEEKELVSKRKYILIGLITFVIMCFGVAFGIVKFGFVILLIIILGVTIILDAITVNTWKTILEMHKGTDTEYEKMPSFKERLYKVPLNISFDGTTVKVYNIGVTEFNITDVFWISVNGLMENEIYLYLKNGEKVPLLSNESSMIDKQNEIIEKIKSANQEVLYSKGFFSAETRRCKAIYKQMVAESTVGEKGTVKMNEKH